MTDLWLIYDIDNTIIDLQLISFSIILHFGEVQNAIDDDKNIPAADSYLYNSFFYSRESSNRDTANLSIDAGPPEPARE